QGIRVEREKLAQMSTWFIWDMWDAKARSTRLGRFGEAGKRRTNALGTRGTKVREVCGSAELDENGTIGLGELGTFGTQKREVHGSAELIREQLVRANLGHLGRERREVRGSAESDENGTIGPGELGTFGTKSSDGPEKNRLRVNRPIGEQRAQLNLGHAGQKCPTGPKNTQNDPKT
ncbi:hypothetical protein KI387_007908, partial [Taxus chinensis]